MTQLRAPIDLKFERAWSLLNQLINDIRAYIATEPVHVYHEIEDTTGDTVTRVRSIEPPPIALSLLIGDIIHNARSALDHLAYALVVHEGGTPTRNTTFPIADQEVGYGAKLRSALPGTSDTTRDAIRRLRPWRDGDDWLWKLHALDIVDKHRLLLPVVAAQQGFQLQISAMLEDESGIPSPVATALNISSEGPRHPLSIDAVVTRTAKAAGDGLPDDEFKIRVGQTPTFELVFGDNDILPGEPLGSSLVQLVAHTKMVVEPVVALLS